jgi:hypothetical protein
VCGVEEQDRTTENLKFYISNKYFIYKLYKKLAFLSINLRPSDEKKLWQLSQ